MVPGAYWLGIRQRPIVARRQSPVTLIGSSEVSRDADIQKNLIKKRLSDLPGCAGAPPIRLAHRPAAIAAGVWRVPAAVRKEVST